MKLKIKSLTGFFGLVILSITVFCSLGYGFEGITGSFVDVTGRFIESQGSFIVDDYPPEIDPISDIIANETDLITVTVSTSDANGDVITIYYGSPLNESGQWQTEEGDRGIYIVTITASDGSNNSTLQFNIKIKPYCGDEICNSTIGEDCSSCLTDCGTCASQQDQGGSGDHETEEEIPQELDETGNEKEQGADREEAEPTDKRQAVNPISNEPILIQLDAKLDSGIIEPKDGTLKVTINLRKSLEITEDVAEVTIKYLIREIDVNDLITGGTIYEEYYDLIENQNYVVYFSETVNVTEDNVFLIKNIDIPQNLASGRYEVIILAEYQDRVALDSNEFFVSTEESPLSNFEFSNVRKLVIIGLSMFLMILAIIYEQGKINKNKFNKKIICKFIKNIKKRIQLK